MPAGKPLALTPKIQETLVTYLRAGRSHDAACAYAGITRQTLRNWLNRGEAAQAAIEDGTEIRPKPNDARCVKLFDAIKKAEADAEGDMIARIMAGEKNWQSSAWWLERRHPKTWGKVDSHHISGPDGSAVHSRVSMGLTEATAEAIRAEILGIGKDDDE